MSGLIWSTVTGHHQETTVHDISNGRIANKLQQIINDIKHDFPNIVSLRISICVWIFKGTVTISQAAIPWF